MNSNRPFPIPSELARILTETSELRNSYLVGGCVRDWLLDLPNKDFDIEVFGIEYEPLAAALARWGRPDLVGRSFGVVRLKTPSGNTFDFTIPRRDSKIAPGHKGFEIRLETGLSMQEAAGRRDFTINALMYDPRSGKVLDFFGGLHDLEHRILRHTSDAFREDPLRVLRGMQFAARFNLTPAPETIALAREMKSGFQELAGARIRDEWFKWASLSNVPSAGLKFLADTEWIEHFPELDALRRTPQDPRWHPEGDVFKHTGHCCDAMVTLPEWQQADTESRIVYMLAILTHDFGKPSTTQEIIKEGQIRIVSPGHEEAGGPITEQFLDRIHAPLAIKKRVVPLVTNHLIHLQTLTERGVRRLAKRLEPENIQSLCVIISADHMGRPPRPAVVPATVRELQAKAAELNVVASPPKPLLMGRHLLKLGMKAGAEFGLILRHAYEAQLEGRICDLPQAFQWLANQNQWSIPPAARRSLREGRLPKDDR